MEMKDVKKVFCKGFERSRSDIFFLFFVGVLFVGQVSYAGVGVGTTTPNAGAILELRATDKAFLPPRMTTAQRNGISSPVEGMMVYDTTEKIQMSYDGTRWTEVGGDPIGTIKAWHKNVTDSALVLPWGWEECDGGTVSDSDSPIIGSTRPDLNGDSRFLRGSSTSGVLQDDDFEFHTHASISAKVLDATDTNDVVDSSAGGGGANSISGVANVANLTPLISAGGSETRPINMSVVWIIRVK